MSKLFWVEDNVKITYSQLISDLNSQLRGRNYIWERTIYKVFLSILHSLVNDYPIILLDGDFSKKEILACGINIDDIKSDFAATNKISSFEEIISSTKKLANWHITLLTSGTTGIPKKVDHSFSSITRAVKVSNTHQNDVWGFAYNPAHMAGIQVFWQAFLNRNTMVNLYKKNPQQVRKLIEDNKITHISATPTFYRMIIDKDNLPFVKQVSSGGEKLSESLKHRLEKYFPNANIRNIYASTEAGSLFASEGENFKVPQRYKDFIKVIDNEIVIHESLMGNSESLKLINGWYHTGDLVEIIQHEPEMIFKFTSRKNEMINVGGFKVNPHEVEEALLSIPEIKRVRVYGKPNPVLGNILMADVVAKNISEKDIRKKLDLQNFKIPRIINFVEEIDLTRTGKVKR